jgi:hypothetical protein
MLVAPSEGATAPRADGASAGSEHKAPTGRRVGGLTSRSRPAAGKGNTGASGAIDSKSREPRRGLRMPRHESKQQPIRPPSPNTFVSIEGMRAALSTVAGG